MDIQLKRGLLDISVLTAIKDEASYGYQIIKDIKPYIEISESTLYPILRRLENQKLLTVKNVEYNGRLRKYYFITKAGLKRLEDLLDRVDVAYTIVIEENDISKETLKIRNSLTKEQRVVKLKSFIKDLKNIEEHHH